MPKIDDQRLVSPQCLTLNPVETFHKNPWFSVIKRGKYYTVESTQQTIILPTLENASVIMVKQLRPVINDFTLELPAGAINKNEDPVLGARRELSEETGIHIEDINRFKPLPPISNSPNRNPCLLYIFHIDIMQSEFDLRKSHDHEISSVELYSYLEIIEKLTSGEIYVSVPMAIIGRYLLKRKS
ncbi:MAG: NUDIX hydrolase [Lentisphaerota bacterium]